VVLREDIPAGHKVAIHDIRAGSTVCKYGEPIGRATTAIRRGAHVHVHNLESLRARATAR
jgi:altronate dehydratase small subunit